MEIFIHNLESLFQQLGLPSSHDDIARFVATHHLQNNQDIISAEFWNLSQKQFLQEAKLQDADWVEQIDLLDSLIRK